MFAAQIANAQALRGDVSHTLGVRAIAMRSQRVSRAVAAAAALHVANERASRHHHGCSGRRAEECRLRSVELERNRKVVTLPADAPAATGNLNGELGRRGRHQTLVVQRL